MDKESQTVTAIAEEKDTVGDFTFPERNKFDAGYGLSEATVDYICDVKNDPDWVRDFRKESPAYFRREAHAYSLGDKGSRNDQL